MNNKYLFSSHLSTRVILVAIFLALADRPSDALFLGNIIGCNSFGCRIAALENDVGQLKQQVARLGGGGGGNTNFQPNQMPYNPNLMNQGNNQQQFGQQQQQQQLNNQLQPNNQANNQANNQQQQGGQNGARRSQEGYSNLASDYPQELRRVSNNGYQNSFNGQF